MGKKAGFVWGILGGGEGIGGFFPLLMEENIFFLSTICGVCVGMNHDRDTFKWLQFSNNSVSDSGWL